MTPDQVRSLIRMGLHVGLVADHLSQADVAKLVEELATPIIAARVTVSREALGLPEQCGHLWAGNAAGSPDVCPGGCRCILDADAEHGGPGATMTPHTCRRGHTIIRAGD